MNYGFLIDNRKVHRLPRVFGGLQGRARGPSRGGPDLGEIRREGRLPRDPAHLPGHPLQPLRGRALRGDLPDHSPLHPPRRHRGLRPASLHRMQGLHAGLPVRRALHRPADRDRRQVQLLRAQGGGRARAALCDRVPHPGHRGGRPRQPGLAPVRPGGARGTQVRKPEKGTRPKLYYIQGDADSLVPSAAPPLPTTCGPRPPRPWGRSPFP